MENKKEFNEWLLRLEVFLMSLSLTLFMIVIFVTRLPLMQLWIQICLLTSVTILLLTSVCYALKIEQIAGYYQCKKCNHKYVPTYKSVFLAPHIGRTRYMRCPECGQKAWHKKTLIEDILIDTNEPSEETISVTFGSKTRTGEDNNG